MEYFDLKREVLTKKTNKSFPYNQIDSEGNTWCILSKGKYNVAILLDDIYKGRKIPTAEQFVEEYSELCKNAMNSAKYMKEQKKEDKKLTWK